MKTQEKITTETKPEQSCHTCSRVQFVVSEERKSFQFICPWMRWSLALELRTKEINSVHQKQP